MMNLPEIGPRPEEGTRCVLIVEDDALIRTGLADELRDAGLHVVEAVNADEAWTYLETGAHLDLIFSDVQMPGSMNGLDLARRVKENYPDIFFILTTGNVGLVSTFHKA
jgi:two-component system, response regulator PdtaR